MVNQNHNRRTKSKSSPLKRHAEVTEDERQLFRQSVGEVERLAHDYYEHAAPSLSPRPRFTRADEQQVLHDALSDWFDPAEWNHGEILQFCRDGLPHTVLRKLRRGQFAQHAELDLHGLGVEAAREALVKFLHRARRQHMSCVRIIHGKGNRSQHRGPVLKYKVNHWLRQREEVLAFCSARTIDGGSGALYVLLRRG